MSLPFPFVWWCFFLFKPFCYIFHWPVTVKLLHKMKKPGLYDYSRYFSFCNFYVIRTVNHFSDGAIYDLTVSCSQHFLKNISCSTSSVNLALDRHMSTPVCRRYGASNLRGQFSWPQFFQIPEQVEYKQSVCNTRSLKNLSTVQEAIGSYYCTQFSNF